MEEARKSRPIRVLVIDDDAGVRDVVAAILGDEGYDVSMLDHLADAAVRAAIDRIEPNCILLDGAEAIGFAKAWTTAADLRRRARPIPTVMFTAHVLDAAEAERAMSERAVAAGSPRCCASHSISRIWSRRSSGSSRLRSPRMAGHSVSAIDRLRRRRPQDRHSPSVWG